MSVARIETSETIGSNSGKGDCEEQLRFGVLERLEKSQAH